MLKFLIRHLPSLGFLDVLPYVGFSVFGPYVAKASDASLVLADLVHANISRPKAFWIWPHLTICRIFGCSESDVAR